MKKGTLIFNVIISLAVATLFVLHFTGKGGKTGKPKTDGTSNPGGSMKTLYINSDSISAGYVMMRDLEAKFEADNAVRQQKLQNKQASLQKMIKDYQNGLMTMTSREQQKEGEKIQAYQQQLEQEVQEFSQMAAVQQQDMMIQVYDSVYAFFHDYAKEVGADMIFSFQTGGQILYINEKYDVTTDAIQKMNQRYLKSKPKEDNTLPPTEEGNK